MVNIVFVIVNLRARSRQRNRLLSAEAQWTRRGWRDFLERVAGFEYHPVKDWIHG